MPSQLHEAPLLLFRNQPTLAAELIRGVLGAELPAFSEARVVAADLTDIKPTEFRADMVIELSVANALAQAIIVEVQLSALERKRFVWPAYVATLYARLECPVLLLIVTADDAVARWAAKPICMGGLHQFTPYVLGPSSVPEVTDGALARKNPELAVLSTLAHGRGANCERAIEIALAARNAIVGLDADREDLYVDLIINSLSEAARRALMEMDLRQYEFQSDWAREKLARSRAEGEMLGELRGRAALVIRMLTTKFGEVARQADDRIHHASIAELDAIGERLLTARTLQEALGPE